MNPAEIREYIIRETIQTHEKTQVFGDTHPVVLSERLDTMTFATAKMLDLLDDLEKIRGQKVTVERIMPLLYEVREVIYGTHQKPYDVAHKISVIIADYQGES